MELLIGKARFDVIHTNLPKAFNSYIGLCSIILKLMNSYLSGGTQFVQILGVRTVEFGHTSGIPQGSILRPLLFAIFINNIA